MKPVCTRPLTAWYSKTKNESGKFGIVFTRGEAAQPDDPFTIPCGRCIGCRFEHSRQWALRCVHEAKLHKRNCFLTLTFDDDHIVKRENPYTVDKRDFQLFMKRLRKTTTEKIGYYHCGEYGDHTQRPHYHACVFNHDFQDKQFAKRSGGHNLYVSEVLNGTHIIDKYFPHLRNRINTPEYHAKGTSLEGQRKRNIKGLWPYGVVLIGDVTFQSAAYTARYVMKKINGQKKDLVDPETGLKHYERYNEFGEIIEVEPEYVTMSRNPAIGKAWIEKYFKDMYPKDHITLNGRKVRPPKYYDRWMQEKHPYEMEYVKDKRKDVNQEYTTVRREQQLDELHIKTAKRFSRNQEQKR